MSAFAELIAREAQEAAQRAEALRQEASSLAVLLTVASIVAVVAVAGAAVSVASSPTSQGIVTLLIVGLVAGLGLMAMSPLDSKRKRLKREAKVEEDLATHLPPFYRDPEPLALCGACGHQLLRIARHCHACGARLRPTSGHGHAGSWTAKSVGAQRARTRAFDFMGATPCHACGAPCHAGASRCGECSTATGRRVAGPPLRRMLLCGACRHVHERGATACPDCGRERAILDLGSCGACGEAVDRARLAAHLSAAHAGTWAALAATS